MKITINKYHLFLFFILSMMALPTVNLLNFEMPVIYLFSPIFGLVFLFVLFGRIKIPNVVKPLVAIWLLIFIQILFSAFISTVEKLGSFTFPTDILQYVFRAFFFIGFLVLAYKERINKDKFIKYFLIILIVGMLVGVLQWIPWPGRAFFIQIYPYRDGSEQLSHLSRSLYAIRMHGFAQFATANGGVASFAFIYAFSIRKYYKQHKGLCMALMILSIVNIFASQARAGMLALAFSLILFYFVDIKYEKKGLKTTVYFISAIVLIVSILVYLYNIDNIYVVRLYDRWIRLFETGGGSRATIQPQYFFSLMKGVDYLFGLSKPIINISAISYGVEIEPINILVTYGITGFLLQYSLILFLLIYFFKRINKSIEDKAVLALIISSFVGLFSYQVFSVAYYFFREIRVGLFPWVLMGIAIGVYERYKLNLLTRTSRL